MTDREQELAEIERERRFVALQHRLPKRAITNFARFVAGNRWGYITTRIIRNFVAKYDVNMGEAIEPRIATYKTFNDFFTRALRAEVRPISTSDFVCPVDGAISQCGAITGVSGDEIFQAKGHHYSTQALVGGDATLAAQFAHGQFATLYLSPRDYHRIHMPCAGTLRRMIHVPGDLYSVNPITARGVPGLFARNERVVCVFEGQFGLFVMVLVGATIVGSMATVWHGQVNPPRLGTVREWTYEGDSVRLEKGAEMGRFLLGSTVVMLFPQDTLAFPPDWQETRPIQMGEAMGTAPKSRSE